MKEIYTLLNEVNTNIDSYDAESLTEEEKRKLFKNIRGTIGKGQGNRRHSRRYARTAACAAVLILFAGIITYNDTAYAAAKNVAWKIGEFLGIENNLQDYTTVVGTSKRDKGYTVTLNEVILDKDQLIVSASVRSDEKFSESSGTETADVYVNGKQVSVAGGGVSRQIDSYTRESVMDYELENVDTSGKLNIEIIYSSMWRGEEKTKGNWNFQFETDGEKLAVDTKHFALDQSFKLPNGSGVVLTEYTSNNLGQKIYFKLQNWDYVQDPMYDLKLEGTDNLGNQVEFDLSYMKGREKHGRLNISSVCEGIGEGAEYLTLKLYAVEMPEKSGRMSNDFTVLGESFIVPLTEK